MLTAATTSARYSTADNREKDRAKIDYCGWSVDILGLKTQGLTFNSSSWLPAQKGAHYDPAQQK